jgi:hypothetical protein
MIETLRDHPFGVAVVVGTFIVITFICLAALTVLVRFLVHSEVRSLTVALHEEVTRIGARLDMLIGRKWTDDRLDRQFDDLRSALNLHDGELREAHRFGMREATNEQQIQAARNDITELVHRIQKLEARFGQRDP